MRLICPNCGAQYAVDDNAIPLAGRDVQCSNCGHAWFQLPVRDDDLTEDIPAPVAEAAAEPVADKPRPVPADKAADPVDPPAEAEPEQPEAQGAAAATPDKAAADPLSALLAQVRGLPSTAATEEDEPAPTASRDGPKMTKPSEGLDESLLAVLREEAAREAQARKRDAGRGVETQPDLGLEAASAPNAAPPARNPVRNLSDLPEDDEDAGDRPAAARRDLLPDIEEINSTLRASDENRPGEDPQDDLPSLVPAQRGSFSRGFTTMVIIAVLLGVLYVAAPRISAAVPALAPAMDLYLETMQAARRWIDGMVQSATAGLQDLTGKEN